MGKTLFDGIDERYDFLNRLFSACLDIWWRRRMVGKLAPSKDMLVLDLATGTGDSASGILGKGARVVGFDLSLNMLARAKQKIRNPIYQLAAGTVYSLPFRTGTFDGLTCAFGIRNMHETAKALDEIFRVMKKGGRIVLLEFSMPRSFIRVPYSFYLKRVMPAIAAMFSERDAYLYLAESIEAFHSPEELCRLIEGTGFTVCKKTPLCFGNVYIHEATKPV
ncbi:MAG: ubiquinone/menaquinone biosynthesis methyltransferase [Nitrospirae bacterium]|nr:MAG: ubiquinone/menaquinone biosynthesis methyltransferase [Nitrospirota bacterium]